MVAIPDNTPAEVRAKLEVAALKKDVGDSAFKAGDLKAGACSASPALALAIAILCAAF